jgi:hypothetical protein
MWSCRQSADYSTDHVLEAVGLFCAKIAKTADTAK